jgi:hypothetical protein
MRVLLRPAMHSQQGLEEEHASMAQDGEQKPAP